MTAPIHHRWRPLADFSADDEAAASDELPALAAVWEEQRTRLGDERALADFNARLAREWAIETGLIERIYTLDRGTTQLLIEQGIDASLITHGSTDKPPELVAAMIADHHAAIEWLFDFVADRRALTTSFVKELHALMTRHQATATGVDQFDRTVEIPLVHGDYKLRPNSPTRPDGSVHEYCPPEQVSSEMERLLALHAEHEKRGVRPEVSAAWLHHRFAQIHPFEDGNGRIARALASLVFLRAGWFPLVITEADKTRYIDALEEADRNGLAALVGVFGARQKAAFVSALGIAREVAQETERVDQVLASIGEMFSRRDAELQREQESAKDRASQLVHLARQRLSEVATELERQMGQEANASRRVFVDIGDPASDRRNWHRAQVLEATHRFGYFAGFGDFSAWVRLCITTESGRGEILLSFHSVGRDYRGVIGAVMVFFRRAESGDGERQAFDVNVAGDESFQVNYREPEDTMTSRFARWLERCLVEALETWRRSE